MRRAVGNIEKRGKGVYKVTVTCGRDPVTGRRRRISKTIHGTATDAEALIPVLAAHAGRPVPAGHHLTLRAYVASFWLPDADVRTNTRADYDTTMRLHILPYLGDAKLDDIKPYTVKRWLKTMDGSEYVRAKAFRVLRACLRTAVTDELIDRAPTDAVEPPTPPDRDLETLSADEANAYLDLFAGHQLELAVMLAITCGMRRSEIAGLKWSDVDFADGTIAIRRGLHRVKGGTKLEPPKSKRSKRHVRPPAFVMDALRAKRGLGPIFTLGPDSITKAYDRHIRPKVDGKKVERVRYIPLRDLRHSAASLLLSSGLAMEEVRDILGHQDVRTTQTFYDKSKRSASRRGAAVMQHLRRGQQGATGRDAIGAGGDS